MSLRIAMYALVAASVLSIGCAGNTVPDGGAATNTPAETTAADTTYMPTGFYYLADGKEGIRMHKYRSEDRYTFAPTPFAGVTHITDVKLVQTPIKNGVYNELCLTFDSVGTKDLAAGTGNPLHPQIAAVVANKLLFVVKNEVSIKTGIMYVGLVDFTDTEMEEIRKSVLSGR